MEGSQGLKSSRRTREPRTTKHTSAEKRGSKAQLLAKYSQIHLMSNGIQDNGLGFRLSRLLVLT